ncbi:MAG: zinc ribbon domain-containing protein [Promethearchaeota archaeon]
MEKTRGFQILFIGVLLYVLAMPWPGSLPPSDWLFRVVILNGLYFPFILVLFYLMYGKDAKPMTPLSNIERSLQKAFCSYCGQPRQEVDARFCAKCGRSFDDLQEPLDNSDRYQGVRKR